MIDYIMVNKRWKNAVTGCRTFVSPDIASDHRLVIAGIRIKLKRRVSKGMMNKRFNTEALRDGTIRCQFSTQLNNKWNQIKRKDTGSVEETWEVIKNMYTEVAQEVLGHKERKKNKPWISKEVLDLSDTRKELRKTNHKMRMTTKGIRKSRKK